MFTKKYIKHEKGATAIEYGILASLIGIVLMNGLPLVGNKLSNVFCNVSYYLADTPCIENEENNNSSNTSSTKPVNNTTTDTSNSSSDTNKEDASSEYDGVYSSDVNSFINNLKSNEENYIDAWKATQTLVNQINEKKNTGDQNGANELVNSQLGPLKQTENEAYEYLHNGEGASQGLTQGLNTIFSQDWNNDLAKNGNTQATSDFDKIKSLSISSNDGKTYTLGQLWTDQGSSYMNDLTGSSGTYPRH